MKIQVGMKCVDQQLCDYISAGFGYLFIGLAVWFTLYIIKKLISNRKK